MAIYVRPFVTSIAHGEGCPKRNYGPACARRTNGWEYHLKLVLPNGEFFEERKKSPVDGKTATQRYAEAREAHVVRESVAPAPVAKKEVPTVCGFCESFMTYSKTNNKPSTVYAKEWMLNCHIIPFFGKTRLDAIGPAEIERYKAAKLDSGLMKKSINNHLTSLRKLLNLAVEWNVLDRAPGVRALREKHECVAEDEYLTFEETPRFMEAVAPEWRTFVIVALKTGLRLGELLALQWQHIDLVAGYLIVLRSLWRGQEGSPKGGQNRKVPLSEVALTALKAHRHLRGAYVFSDERGNHLTRSMLKDVVPSACARAKLAKRITTHGLRHTFASHLVMRAASLKAVQELLGHESIEMTLRYSHLTPDVKREAVQMLDVTDAGLLAPQTDNRERYGSRRERQKKAPGVTGVGLSGKRDLNVA
jgi:integrase